MPSVTMVPVKQLEFLDSNPRKIERNQLEKLCESIKSDPDFFENRPCLVNEVDGKMTVYAGNQRLRAAKKLGWKQVPCIVEQNLPEETLRRRIVLDNVSHGEFDFDILACLYDVDELLLLGLTENQLHINLPAIDDTPVMDEPEKEICELCKQEIKKNGKGNSRKK